MARIFLSHSSKDNAEARALGDWLAENGWPAGDVFLDIDKTGGIAPGERWQKALNDAANRCEVVIFLISKQWLASKWCLEELSLAHKLNKRLFGVLIDSVRLDDIPARLRDEWQQIDLDSGRDGIRFDVELPGGKQGHATFSRSGLEKLRVGLVKAGLDPSFFAWPPVGDPKRPPYRGLAPMEAEDAGIFYGREAATIAALDQLRGLAEMHPPRLMAILGASGAGKSSFMRAGLIPRLKRDEHHFLVLPPVRPQRAAISGDSGLISSLEQAASDAGLKWTRSDVRKALAGGADAIAALLADLTAATVKSLGGAGEAPTVVLPLDQAEELFHSDGGTEAAALLDIAAALLMRDDIALIVLATIRTDSYEQMQAAPALTDIRQSTYSLPALARGAYLRVIEGPPERLKGSDRALRIEPALTAALLADIEEGGAKDALPLLAFTLERLYLDHKGKGELTLADYRDSGGIGGAIEAAVGRALAAADSDPAVPRDETARLALLRRAMIPWLAGIDPDSGSPRRQVARFADIPDEAKPLVEHLANQRLLATDIDAATGERTVEPAHEALLRQWGLVDGWLKEDVAVLASLEGVRRAARDWDANARHEGWLQHAGGRLADAEAVHARADLARRLDAADLAYLAACRAAENARVARELRSARLIRFAAIAATLFAVVAAGAAWWGLDRAREAERQAEIADSRLAAAIDSAEAMVSDLAGRFGSEKSMPTSLVRRILDRAIGLIADVEKTGGGSHVQSAKARANLAAGYAYRQLGELEAAKNAVGLVEAALLEISAEGSQDAKTLKASLLRLKGDIAQSSGNLDAAPSFFREELAIRRELVFTNPADGAFATEQTLAANRLGDALVRAGQFDEAEQLYDEQLAWRRQLLAKDPDNPVLRRALIVSLIKVTDRISAAGKLDEATKRLAEAEGIAIKLVAEKPDDWEPARDLATILERQSDLAVMNDDPAYATIRLDRAVAIRSELRIKNPDRFDFAREFAATLDRSGRLAMNKGEIDSAKRQYDAAKALRTELVTQSADDPARLRDLFMSAINLGDLYLYTGDVRVGALNFTEALSISEKLTQIEPQGTSSVLFSTLAEAKLIESGTDGMEHDRKSLENFIAKYPTDSNVDPQEQAILAEIRRILEITKDN